MIKLVTFGGTVVILAYAAMPYWNLYSVANAIEAADVDTLETSIDWPRVRDGIKQDFQVVWAASIEQTQKEQPAKTNTAFGAGLNKGIEMLAVGVVNAMIDSKVTPANISHLLRQRTLKVRATKKSDSTPTAKPVEPVKLTIDNVRYAFFTSPTNFRVDLIDPKEPDGVHLRMRMELQSLSWKITRVYLPVDSIIAAEAKQKAAQAAKEKETPRLLRPNSQ